MNKLFIIKCALLVFSLLVGIIGVVMLVFTVYYTGVTTQGNSMVIGDAVPAMWMWLTTVAIFSLAALGAYGSYKEKKTQLIVFCVLMWIITVILVFQSFSTIVIFHKVKSEMDPIHQQTLHKPLIIIMGIFFGTGVVTFVGGLLSKLMVNQIKQRSDVQTSIPPMDSPPLLTSEC